MKELVKNLELDVLESTYINAKNDYYTNGTSVLSDEMFDELEERLISMGSKVVNKVGVLSLKEMKIPHPTPMLSQRNIKANQNNDAPLKDLLKWLPIESGLLEFTPKFDGNAVNLIYVDGKLDKAITRGDGHRGQDITDKIKHVVPHILTEKITCEIRGEVVMKKSIFESKYSEFKNPRNFVAGVLNKKEYNNNFYIKI